MAVLIPLLVLAGLAWAAVFLWRGRLIDGCLGLLLAIACFGHPFFHLEGGPPLTIDRVLLGCLLGACLVQRTLRQTRRPSWQPADLALVAFLGWLVLSFVAGLAQGGATPPLTAFWQLFLGYGTPALVYFLARHGQVDRPQIGRVHVALTVFGVYLGLIGMLEIAKLWPLVFPRYIADPTIGLHFGRARGPMIHSVSYGLYLCACLGAAWLLAWRWGLSRRWQLLVLGTLPIILAGIALTYTRSVWIGAGLAVLTVLSLTLRGVWRPLFWGTAICGGALLLATQLDNLMGFKREFTEAETRDSAQVRQVFAYVSWLMFQDRPLAGVGFGQFRTAKLPYLVDRASELRLQAIREWVHHNNYLGLLTETGLLGLALFLSLGAVWIRLAWRGWSTGEMPDWGRTHALLFLAVLGVWAAQLAFHELSFSPIDNALVFFLAGLSVSLVEVYLPRPQPAAAAPGVEAWNLPAWPSERLRQRLLGHE